MVDDLDEKSEGFDLQRYLGIVRRRHLVPDTAVRGVGRGVGSELGAAAALPLDYFDSGGTTHHAEGLRHTERER